MQTNADEHCLRSTGCCDGCSLRGNLLPNPVMLIDAGGVAAVSKTELYILCLAHAQIF